MLLAFVLDMIVNNCYYLCKFVFLNRIMLWTVEMRVRDYKIIYVSTVGLYVYLHMWFMWRKHMNVYVYETRLRRYKPLLMYRSLVIAYRFTEVKMVTFYRSRLQT